MDEKEKPKEQIYEPEVVWDDRMVCHKTICTNCKSQLRGITPYCPQCGVKVGWSYYWRNRKQARGDLDY